MSDILYLVRPYPGLLRSIITENYIRYPTRAFWNDAAAEQYAATNQPLALNLFANCYADEYYDEEDEETDELTFFLAEENAPVPEPCTVSLKALVAHITALGLPPPDITSEDFIADEALPAWWEANAPAMSDDQKRSLWQFCVPEPYQIIPVEWEE